MKGTAAMTLPKNILVATDFSSSARRAGEAAVAWAERLGATVSWAHGVEHLSASTPPSASPLISSYVEKARQHGEEQLSAALEMARGRGLKGEGRVVDAPAARGVVELARQLDADCIFVGSRGHNVLRSLVLGSVAERIVRDAHCSVMVVRGETSPEAPGTVVLGDDLSETSEAARVEAIALARALQARLDVVHAPDLGIPYFTSLGLTPPDRIFEDLRSEASERMAELMSEAPAGVEVGQVIARDTAAHAICERAKQVAAGLVVVGSRSPSDIERVLLGSVADRVVRHAPCSVLVVR
jgi:nucleotide-binding universal stress UspA family protein